MPDEPIAFRSFDALELTLGSLNGLIYTRRDPRCFTGAVDENVGLYSSHAESRSTHLALAFTMDCGIYEFGERWLGCSKWDKELSTNHTVLSQ